MNLKLRRVIYISAILTFLIASPLLLFYISGYRFDVYQRSIRTTGSLFITTKPDDAQIFLNNQLLKTKTPLRLNHLNPNTYSIRIEKEGFQSYHKTLEVRGKETTILENIILWPEEPELETLISSGNINNFSLDPQERFIIYQDNNNIKRYHIANKETITILPIKGANKDTTITWSQDGLRALINNNDNYWVYAVENNSIVNLSQILSQNNLYNNTNIKFDPTNSSNLLLISNNKLFNFNLSTAEYSQIIEEEITDYLYKNNKLYVITATDNAFITSYSNINETTPLFQLPKSEQYQIVDIITNQAMVYTADTRTMYFFTLDAEEFNNTSHFIQNVDAWEINAKSDTVLLTNAWEIWTYDISNRKSTLINRFSKPITASAWYPDNNYIFVSFADEIKTIELDRRDFRNTAQIWNQNSMANFVLSDNGEFIYLMTNSEDKNKIIRLNIFEPDSFFGF